MAYDVSATFSTEQAKIEGAYPLQMISINASLTGYDPLYYIDLNQDVYGYQVNASGNLTATEVLYTGLPLEIDTFSTSGDGKIPELTISVPNIDRVMEEVIQDNKYLRSKAVYVLTTFAESLPASSLDYRYLGSNSDRGAIIKEKVYISGVSSNEQAVSFTCKPKFDLMDARIPGRTFTKECSWIYGDSCCDPHASVLNATYPTCNYTLDNCKERSNAERYGGFPSVPRNAIVIL